MTQDNSDILVRVTLPSLRKHIDQIRGGNIPEKYVSEYHDILNRVQDIIDIAKFRIPDSEVKPIITRSAPVSRYSGVVGKASYSEEKYVDKPFILMKLDAILGYLEIILSEKPRDIGFRKPDKD